MDDSDDLFEDLILDEATIAALEAHEQRYLSQSQKGTTESAYRPLAKRQRTDSDWTPTSRHFGPGIDVREEIYELPDITLNVDGSYDVRHKEKLGGAISLNKVCVMRSALKRY